MNRRSYFAFALVGLAFFDYLTVSLTAFDNDIMEARQNGTLEAMLVSETPLTILGASAAYFFVLLSLLTAIYLALGLFYFPRRGDPDRWLSWVPLACWAETPSDLLRSSLEPFHTEEYACGAVRKKALLILRHGGS